MTIYPRILTASKAYFDFTNPEAYNYHIEVIAAALSKLCRFTGHTRLFYSVAQHSVLVSHLVPPEMALAGLLHDAPEAFLGDVSSPLKALLPEYKTLEHRVWQCIASSFDLSVELPAEVKHADMVALVTEEAQLMPPHDDIWFDGKYHAVPGLHIVPQEPSIAESMFLRRYAELINRRNGSC